MGDNKKISAADIFGAPETASTETPAVVARPNPRDIFGAAEDVGKPTPITAPESWADVPEAYVKNAGQIALNTINAIPGAVQKAVNEPGKAAENVAKGGTHMIKSLLSAAGLPLTLPAWAIASMVPKLPGAKKSMGEQFREEYLEPGFALGRGMAEDYGGWLGGDEGWGFTPEKGLERLKKTITTKPYSFTADVVGVPGAVATVGRGLKTTAKVGQIADAAEAAKKLSTMGIDLEHLTPPQMRVLQDTANAAGWDKATIEQARRRMLFDEAGITPTSSMITGSEAERRTEDLMRNGSRGAPAAEIINQADEARRGAFNDYVDRTRLGVSGAPEVLTPDAIGTSLKERWNAAHEAARQRVNAAYDRAFNLDELVANNIPTSVSYDTIKGLPDRINQKAFDKGYVITEKQTPNAKEAKRMLEEYSRTGRLPKTMFGEPIPWGDLDSSSWQAVDAMRKQLNSLRNSAKSAARAGDATDLSAMRTILDAFDEQFGKANPLLNDARKMHSERVNTFDPARNNAASGFKSLTDVLNNPANEGLKAFGTLFESGDFTKGVSATHLKKMMEVFKDDPAAMSALREGVLQRLTRDPKTYEVLSPQKLSSALDEALDGRRAGIYRMVLNPSDISSLKRLREVAGNYAEHVRPENPPKSGHIVEREARTERIANRWGESAGAISSLLASAAGFGTHGPAGAGVGAAAGVPGYMLGKMAGRTIGEPLANRSAAREAARLSSPMRVAPMPPPMSLPLRGSAAAALLGNAEPEQRKRGGYLSTMRRG